MVDGETVRVRRQWNDHRIATFRFADLQGLHWSDVSGGAGLRAPREFLSGYVLCTGMLDGDLAHACRHGPPPHRIKVCVTRKDNTKAVYERLLHRATWEFRLSSCPWKVESPTDSPLSAERADGIERWLNEHWPEDGYARIGFAGSGAAPQGVRPQVWFSNPMPAGAFATEWGWRSRGHQNQEKRRKLALLLALATR